MKSLEEQAAGLVGDDYVEAPCPLCGENQAWWPEDDEGTVGLECMHHPDCAYVLDLSAPTGPPIIMCSHCGGPLEPGEAGYSCGPCARTVRP